MSVQIFLSYARTDDLLPPNMQDGKGFVTCLLEQINFEFQQLGAPWPKIWRDTRNLELGDIFDPVIEDAIQKSDLLLIVLSPNWMESEYCRKELDSFGESRKQEGELRVKQRIVVACKRFVERGRRPSLLQGQPGYDFFAFDGPGESGSQLDYFARGMIRDKRYDTVVGALAGFLHRRAQQIVRPTLAPLPAPSPVDDRPVISPPRSDARKIYLAKPASDMREAYARLIQELCRNGYAVVPDLDREIPHDTSATSYVDAALTEAEASIHLLGEGEGFAPEASDPVVRLQLARAAVRLSAATQVSHTRSRSFQRIVWAPEAIEDGAEPSSVKESISAAAGQQSAMPASNRRPDEVLGRFGTFEPGDKVLGGTLSKFVDFVIEHLRQSDISAGTVAEPTEDDWIYVYHVPEDTQFACDLTDALRQRGIAANLPALEGDAAEVRQIHQQYLAECSAVVLCWAQATEAWAHAHAYELKDWKKLGRQKKFNYRGLLAGPPPGTRKLIFAKYPPANEIDVVVNQIEQALPLAQAIDKFIGPPPTPAQ